ncbi:ATP-binding protein [Thermomicrobium sp. 4228-Ro]|uniref:helicase HerA domain-containing protein n=1 Tax=Thermomicrobium sp. 4228-Ro TaxID=2993937 RepID=UPI002248E764|nr:ATP-binding protein [Thermomicrobium sp. 4228-Ro]MCX2727367.1 ATP-binding protein [Thermomicrobium sp. 4228-Ro]
MHRPDERDDADHCLLGVVTEGSFSRGLRVRLLDPAAVEHLRVGSFVVLEGDRHRYFGMVTDLSLDTTDSAIAADPPLRSSFASRILRGTQAYAVAEIRPSLELEHGNAEPQPARTIPPHFAHLRQATAEDFAAVFGHEDATHFALGTPPAMDIPVPIDLAELVKRSNGVFGQSGSGKSVLTRLLLIGLILADEVSVLLFDMHNEYARALADQPQLVGLLELFGPSRVHVYTLDDRTERSAAARTIHIGLDQIEPGDIELLAEELNLNPTFATVAHHLYGRFGREWIVRTQEFDSEAVKAFCSETGVAEASVNALRSKLGRLVNRPYIRSSLDFSVIDEIIQKLQKGTHVIVQFGKNDSFLDYMLVANLLTRRIHSRYTEEVLEAQLAGGETKVRPLVIVLEEAHKFLTPEAARQSIFGTIAREMRKYRVTLLIVDQRPSSIDREILSQLGTKIIGPLSDQQDIEAVLTGVADRSGLRNLLANLSPRQECVIVGHAVRMPVAIRTRPYRREDMFALVRSRPGHSDGSERAREERLRRLLTGQRG